MFGHKVVFVALAAAKAEWFACIILAVQVPALIVAIAWAALDRLITSRYGGTKNSTTTKIGFIFTVPPPTQTSHAACSKLTQRLVDDTLRFAGVQRLKVVGVAQAAAVGERQALIAIRVIVVAVE